MSRIAECFAALKTQGRSALIPYIAAGDPQPQATLRLMHTLVKSGADIIELGVPFSDPMADGPVIQRAAERALEHDVSLHDVLDMVSEFRNSDANTPVVLMGYLNPIEVMGYEAFAEAASKAGVDGVLTVDLPPEEGSEFLQALKANQLDPVFLIAPTSDASRIKRICEASSGYVYYVSLKGITGAGHLDIGSVKKKVEEIRALSDLPVGVGFGIKDAETAAKMAEIADAVVVGSAIVSRIEAEAASLDAVDRVVGEFVTELSSALQTRE
ncbi:tryptophan synthase subunit alpha [Solemya elarraichensis gill symbiont]|uniref:Tryptophan synthase alpha chain n=1 Tax=Solemya elarraichensis gill symbiont TaxID=1918949 RepID=A0A1T2KZX7_9GAMM|nr:tryptophan synthase subunit alpha [Solemya elarraichensis gill symbiont]OOZ38354.1 tryptophan synthase subunit alpha [Solemya elarraichensis gill symbiont]